MIKMPLTSNERNNQKGGDPVSLLRSRSYPQITEVIVIATKNTMITAITITIGMPLITYLPSPERGVLV
jgi:hypothetical protein